jgi:predicted PurR-regulated permease PerM
MNDKQWSMPLRFITLGILIILFAIGIWVIQPVLQPLIIAAFIAYLINPVVDFLTKRTKLSRRAAVFLSFSISVLVMIGAPASMTLFLDEMQQIIKDVGTIFKQLTVWLAQPLTIAGYPIDLGQLAARLADFRATFIPSLAENALQLLEQTSLGALWIIVTLVAVYYFLAEWPHLHQRMIQSFPPDSIPEVEELYNRLRAIWMHYLRSQILLMVIVGVVFSIAWTILGIPGALVLGIIAGFLTLIPDVGPFIAAILATAVALLEGSSWINLPNFGVALIVIVVYLVLIGIKNFWLRPFILGRSVHMPEPLVFIFIVMATVLWGILGALLIIPVIASLAVIFDYLRRRILGMPPFPDPVLVTKAKHAPPAEVPHSKNERGKQNED